MGKTKVERIEALEALVERQHALMKRMSGLLVEAAEAGETHAKVTEALESRVRKLERRERHGRRKH